MTQLIINWIIGTSLGCFIAYHFCTTMDKVKDWPTCEKCHKPITTYLVVFGKTLIMHCKKCTNSDK